jgi:hypothetical protein
MTSCEPLIRWLLLTNFELSYYLICTVKLCWQITRGWILILKKKKKEEEEEKLFC